MDIKTAWGIRTCQDVTLIFRRMRQQLHSVLVVTTQYLLFWGIGSKRPWPTLAVRLGPVKVNQVDNSAGSQRCDTG